MQGNECGIMSATPYLLLPGQDVGTPTTFAPGWTPLNLTLVYQDFNVDFIVPDGIEPGRRYFLALVVYADCPFASEGELVERPTMRVPFDIVSAQANP